uniref:Uncharacterized protein n=1 Tax=Romanomermis culicivorax TaxID=13658 RepID=A0A915HLD1_ROMCU
MKHVNVSLVKSPEIMASNVRMNLRSANKDRTETHSRLSQASGAPGDTSHKVPILGPTTEKTEKTKMITKIKDEQHQTPKKTDSGMPGLVNYADVIIEKPLDIRMAMERQLRQKRIVQTISILTVVLLCLILLIIFAAFLSGSVDESGYGAIRTSAINSILNSTNTTWI